MMKIITGGRGGKQVRKAVMVLGGLVPATKRGSLSVQRNIFTVIVKSILIQTIELWVM
jgi:hypothetical protein